MGAIADIRYLYHLTKLWDMSNEKKKSGEIQLGYFFRKLGLLWLLSLFTLCAVGAEAQIGWVPPKGQSLRESLKMTEPLSFCNEQVPLDETDVQERLERELLVALDQRDTVILWLKRVNRYFPHIEKALRDNSLPDDLKYIVITESGLRPLAISHKGAAGFWQFIESTGNRYGMKINSHIDERRNLFYSTDAAIKYFKDLYTLFGSWTLAAAAYNMGEDGLLTEILMQKENSFYHLFLNDETQRYVFKVLAAKMILSNPEQYGFSLTEDDLYKPLQFERVQITVDQPVPLYIISKASNTYFKTIKDLNPHIKNYDLHAGQHDLLLPLGSSPGFFERYGKLLQEYRDEKNKSIYTVKKGETLSEIAKRFNVSIKAILLWNGITNANRISSGDKLLIFSHVETIAR
jgi:LysM repeat protein